MLEAVDAVIQQEEMIARRNCFMVHAGEAVLIDNWRCLHGRNGFSLNDTQERRLWRTWCWTRHSNGIPDGVPAVGSISDADKIK